MAHLLKFDKARMVSVSVDCILGTTTEGKFPCGIPITIKHGEQLVITTEGVWKYATVKSIETEA